ncbi:hypothetical protein P153DRAFT_368081 [Dothidotthia symphoricarpi CBS 119687]|uniref:Uncharacterized protein n=1 Tax=Dothidotthia symphoricarpi CBS 119687 TaxID=1392245 RepID=A0A6A6A8P6_9PLEO|nr:uncharacterized protein P153DRAFT_368081 [Dothidotthia symphoricarpi CBS 119687]KAF2128210.1 hypothetical protein P153DRAFT_368081 [Dothidotthia symphoricarpi CBS 119687]
MSTTSTSSSRRTSTTHTTLSRTTRNTHTSLPEFTLISLDSATPTPSATLTSTSVAADTTSPATFSSDVNPNEAELLGAVQEPTGQLSKTAAAGVGVGVAVFILLFIAVGFWFFKIRSKRLASRPRSPSNVTSFTVDNDQKTLVPSMPNSPRHPTFDPEMSLPAEFYAGLRRTTDGQRNNGDGVATAMEEVTGDNGLTATEKALPPAPTQERLFALNVNINKSMLFDEEAARMVRDSTRQREPIPRWRFKEVLPPVPGEARVLIAQQPVSSIYSSEFELDRMPTLNEPPRIYSTIYDDDKTDDEPQLQGRRISALSRLERGGPPLPFSFALPDLQPPSPSFSFRSYDWYQDIISDQAATDSPTTPHLPHRNPARAINPLAINPPTPHMSLLPAPLSPGFPKTTSLLHPNSAATSLLSPTNANFRLSPTVYQQPPPSRSSPVLVQEFVPPPSPLQNIMQQSARSSRALSQKTQMTHNSRSWLPDEGVYLPNDDGSPDSFEMFVRRPSRADSYSPLA